MVIMDYSLLPWLWIAGVRWVMVIQQPVPVFGWPTLDS